ncbi:hypothetical protein [Leptospira montravelensis]|nr:hypothetical protein [Leptospira montravelensis]
MSKKRLRIFADPNGSGKSTFINQFESSDPRYKLLVIRFIYIFFAPSI